MKKLNFLFYSLFILLFSSNVLAQSGWVKQPVNSTNTLIGMYFINDNTGWITGDSSIILSTTNGGTNWTKNTYFGGGTLVSAYFKNQSTGIIGGYLSSHLNGFILKTTNGGNQWSSSGFSGEPYDIFSFGGDTVWSSRHDGNVMRSTNMGNTWTSSFILQQLELYTVFFINNLTGWTGGAIYQQYAYIYKTTNGGISWFNQFITFNKHFYSIYFVNDLTGFAATLGGSIYRTSNGGDDWLTVLSATNNTLYKIRFPDLDTGFAVGVNGRILKTANSGTNWNSQILPVGVSSSTTFLNVNFRNPLLGWVIGDGGTILKTTNSGNPVGIENITNKIPTEFILSQNYPNPFNPTTTIEFSLPKDSYARLVIYDINGKEVEMIVNSDLTKGSYKVTFDGSRTSSGIYYYKLTTKDYSDTKKFVLIK